MISLFSSIFVGAFCDGLMVVLAGCGVKQGWLAGGAEQLDVEEFGEGFSELKGEGDFVGLDVDDGEAAKGLLVAVFQFVGEGEAVEGLVAAGLGEADDGEFVVEGEAA